MQLLRRNPLLPQLRGLRILLPFRPLLRPPPGARPFPNVEAPSIRLVSSTTSKSKSARVRKSKLPIVKKKVPDRKWTTLEHQGVWFPPPYEPHGVGMVYDGTPIALSPEAEEVASFFAALLQSDHATNPIFVKNFFASFRQVLKRFPTGSSAKIRTFKKVDLSPIAQHLEEEKAAKTLSVLDKKLAKEERERVEAPYQTCLLDGKVEKVGNFKIEPPGLFRGRGAHPKTGMLKTRVEPEQVTINIGKDATVPPPPPGHSWKEVIHDSSVSWLAHWKENISNSDKYVWLAADSSLKGQSDLEKFEKARTLKNHIGQIRHDYTLELGHEELRIRQRATSLYLLDQLALRSGSSDKGDEGADTVGCCSLRVEHVSLSPPSTVTFDFLGKDSIRYTNDVLVSKAVFDNFKLFKASKKKGDLLFDQINVPMLNKHLATYMPGLTAKVFRTYNASWTFVQQLELNTPVAASVADKILAYNRANRTVAILCNHQRSVSSTHEDAMEKMEYKILALKYQRKKLCRQLRTLIGLLSSSEKEEKQSIKKHRLWLDGAGVPSERWIEDHEIHLVAWEREKIVKNFEKENRKLVEADRDPLGKSELQSRLGVADRLAVRLANERKEGWVLAKYDSLEKIGEVIQKVGVKIAAQEGLVVQKDEGKEISLGTSKINYLDPRITFAWCKKHSVKTEKMLSATLIRKFAWASDVGADWEF